MDEMKAVDLGVADYREDPVSRADEEPDEVLCGELVRDLLDDRFCGGGS